MEEAVELGEAEAELVEVRGRGPAVGDGAVLVGPAVTVVVDEAGDLLLLDDVERAVREREPERLVETLGDPTDPHLFRWTIPSVDQEDRAVAIMAELANLRSQGKASAKPKVDHEAVAGDAGEEREKAPRLSQAEINTIIDKMATKFAKRVAKLMAEADKPADVLAEEAFHFAFECRAVR